MSLLVDEMPLCGSVESQSSQTTCEKEIADWETEGGAVFEVELERAIAQLEVYKLQSLGKAS